MTEKHFQLIADVIYHCDVLSGRERHILAKQMAHALQSTNPAFDSDHFIIACMDRPLKTKKRA